MNVIPLPSFPAPRKEHDPSRARVEFPRSAADIQEPRPSELALRSFLEETLAPLRLIAAYKKLRLETFVAPDVPDAVVADAERLHQILANVAGNAVRFTEAGEVSVRVQRENVPGEEVQLRFSVSDTGAGIHPHQQALIFQPVHPEDGAEAGHHGERGLAIAAQLVELMGGRISLESRPGKGSTFRFTVRLRLAAPAAARVRPLRILVVDDSRFNVLFTTETLARQGHTVTAAGGGAEALSAAKAQSFDLIVMDVQMPGMDGLQAAAEIRMRERAEGAHVPILAMTARATPEDRDMCLRAGMDGYVCKPVTADALLRAISELVPSRPVAAPGPPAGGLDLETLLGEVGGDIQLLRRLAGIFAQEVERRLADLRKATMEGDAPGVRDSAHALKGMIGHWGKGSAFEAARRLEDRGRGGDPADAAAVEALAREIATLQADLGKILQEETP